MATETLKNNLLALLHHNTALAYILPKLAAAGIRYGLYAGAHVSVLTGNRVPTDVDLLVHDDDLGKLKALFPFAKTTDVGGGVFLYIGKNDVVEFMGTADIVKDGHTHPFRLTDEAAERITTLIIDGIPICMVDPVDSILLKSILQRGSDQGKHDLEDIAAMLQAVDVDVTYLSLRLTQAGALERTKSVFATLGITIDAARSDTQKAL